MAMTDPRTLYRESAVRGASPVRLVVMLYEQIVEDLRQAIRAIEENRIEARTHAINHAIVIIGHLQNKLDHTHGGEVARNLEWFYNVSRQKLLEAQLRASQEILTQQISLFLGLRDAWIEVDHAEAARAGPLPTVGSESAGAHAEPTHADWKG
ncbi:MAG TPA: flagellar export chaperone FliS [Terriglobales bacterium]|nr:flagellar export chaperone FliS [Terriglobales bacterium]